MCATSPAFFHPSFFPLDPFHLFYENCMVHIWDLWVIHSSADEKIHMDTDMASQLGEEIERAMNTLPPSLSGPIRNPYKKRHSQYKVYEWMALLHWYIIPIASELGFDEDVLNNFTQFVDIVEIAMSHTPKSDEDLASLYNLIKSFLEGFERLYVDNDPVKVSRCRLCIWQLIHVSAHIAWNGSIRFGSQATVERAIGEIGHKVRSKKARFANIATILFQRANCKVLSLRYPMLNIPSSVKRKREHLFQSLPVQRAEQENPSEYYSHLAAICDYLGITFDADIKMQRWGKCRLPGDVTLRSKISEQANQAKWSFRYFEAEWDGPFFGEALAFYHLPDHDINLVVCYLLEETANMLGRWCGVWSQDCMVFETSCLTKLVGIWVWESKVHILRKHAGLEMLNVEEQSIEEEEE